MSRSKVRFTSELLKDLGGGYRELRKRADLDGAEVRVGLPAGKMHKERATGGRRGKPTPAKQPISVAYIGAVHEFGAPERGIPERPWLRPGIRSGTDDFIRLNRINLVKILKGEMNGQTALRQLGAMAVGKVQKYIRNGAFIPLKPATIARKGSSQPLIDTGQMIQSVTFEVGKKESGE